MRPDREVVRQTARVAIGTFAMVALMIAVYAILGRLSGGVVLGGLYTGALTVANFFVMGMAVQGIATCAAEKQRDEQELQAFSKQMEARMRLNRSGRMVVLLLLVIVGIRFLGFDPLATILPVAFPTVVIRVLQIIDIKRESSSKGSEKP